MIRPILLVEDDENDVFFLHQAVTKAGVTAPLHVASDGQKAIDYLHGSGEFQDREKFPLPCLILLDLKLPHVMGLDVLKWIRQNMEHTSPVIILTSSRNGADVNGAYRYGASAYLVKPTGVARLLETVQAIKDFWLTQNIPPGS